MNHELVKEAAELCGTPAFIFDMDLLKERLQMIHHTLGNEIALCYAMKANPFLVDAMNGLTERFEVCSMGEFHICERAGIPMERIMLSGVNKAAEDIKEVLTNHQGKGIFTIESWEHLRILQEAGAELGQEISALIRVTSGNQFGMDEADICKIVADRVSYPNIVLKGLQYYSGTQKKRLSRIEKELCHLDEFCSTLKMQYGFEVQELEYGPGFYVPYFQGEEEKEDELLLGSFRDLLKSLQFKGRITLEMGRYMAAHCGYYLTRIVDTKINKGQNYAIVDGGINHLNYYGQSMAMKLPHVIHLAQAGGEDRKEWTVCGSLCTSADIIVKQLPLQNAGINDILVFERLGAYSVTEGLYLFLSRDLPKVYSYSEKEGFCLLRDSQPTDIINSKRIGE